MFKIEILWIYCLFKSLPFEDNQSTLKLQGVFCGLEKVSSFPLKDIKLAKICTMKAFVYVALWSWNLILYIAWTLSEGS